MKKNYLSIIAFALLLLTATSGYCTRFTVSATSNQFAFSPDSVVAFIGDTIQFNLASIHSALEVSQATWNANGNTSNGGFSVNFGGGQAVMTSPGIHYYVCGNHYFMGMKGRIIVVETGVNNLSSSSSGLDVFPNPFSSGVTFKTNLPGGKENQLRIFDRAGRCIYEKNNIAPIQYLDLSDLQAGVYFVAIRADDLVLEKKLMVSK